MTELEILRNKGGIYMYYFLLIAIMLGAGLFVFFTDKYFEFKRAKELFKANLSYKISLVSGAFAALLILILIFTGE